LGICTLLGSIVHRFMALVAIAAVAAAVAHVRLLSYQALSCAEANFGGMYLTAVEHS
jgi:hypothetical protein